MKESIFYHKMPIGRNFTEGNEEELPLNMPEPRGHPVTILSAFVDTNGNYICFVLITLEMSLCDIRTMVFSPVCIYRTPR
jgi:hypothetical protein